MAEQTISAGTAHSCVVYDGAAWCWGEGMNGRLGVGNEISSSKPVAADNLNDGVTAIAAGGSHTCAIVNTGVRCWGSNSELQIGASLIQRSTPTVVRGLENSVTAISAGGLHTCAIVGVAAQCWGDNTERQLGAIDVFRRLQPRSRTKSRKRRNCDCGRRGDILV